MIETLTHWADTTWTFIITVLRSRSRPPKTAPCWSGLCPVCVTSSTPIPSWKQFSPTSWAGTSPWSSTRSRTFCSHKPERPRRSSVLVKPIYGATRTHSCSSVADWAWVWVRVRPGILSISLTRHVKTPWMHPMVWHRHALKNESCHGANFAITGGTAGCRDDNLRWHQRLQSWHHDDFRFSSSCLGADFVVISGIVGCH